MVRPGRLPPPRARRPAGRVLLDQGPHPPRRRHPGATGGGAPRGIGEIYVIAVDPDFQGLGLGSQLTLAGLASIAARGIDIGMLYVDGDNTAAMATYRSLGFTVHRTDRAYTADVAAAS